MKSSDFKGSHVTFIKTSYDTIYLGLSLGVICVDVTSDTFAYEVSGKICRQISILSENETTSTTIWYREVHAFLRSVVTAWGIPHLKLFVYYIGSYQLYLEALGSVGILRTLCALMTRSFYILGKIKYKPICTRLINAFRILQKSRICHIN